MRKLKRKRWKLTEGVRARALAYLLVIVCSAALGALAVLHLDKNALFRGFSWYQIWIVVAAAIGGTLALFLAGDRLGQAGRMGAFRGAAGGIWVTMIGALIGGTLALPLYGTMFGPFIVIVTLAGAPILFLLWVFNLIGLHVLMSIYVRERDSIFTPERMTQPDMPDSLRARIHGRFI
ncbi:MAG: hypothetical protein AAGL89_19130 [Pseudomonadota bacterium]